MNYHSTFITVAEDSPTETSVVPEPQRGKETVASIQYALLADRPYTLTQEDVLFETHARHKGIDPQELTERGEALRAEFFAEPKPCLRSSPLPKRYGWGFHFDAQGRVALCAMESEQYRALAENDASVKVLAAMRSKRA